MDGLGDGAEGDGVASVGELPGLAATVAADGGCEDPAVCGAVASPVMQPLMDSATTPMAAPRGAHRRRRAQAYATATTKMIQLPKNRAADQAPVQSGTTVNRPKMA
jgi:hypothetical protein